MSRSAAGWFRVGLLPYAERSAQRRKSRYKAPTDGAPGQHLKPK